MRIKGSIPVIVSTACSSGKYYQINQLTNTETWDERFITNARLPNPEIAQSVEIHVYTSEKKK
jgi:hypothetical protein